MNEFFANLDVWALVSAAIPVILGVSVVWKYFSKFLEKASKVSLALKEMADVISVFTKSIDDKELSKAEWTSIKKEINEAIGALKNILK